jgi:TRAP-type C4-dicarboxylate transport system substrate-binding protein
VSLDAVKKMSADDQKVVEEIGKSGAKKLRKVIRKANEEAKLTMKKRGIVTVETPQTTIDAFEKAAKEVADELAGKMFSKQELDMVIKYRDEHRAKNKK